MSKKIMKGNKAKKQLKKGVDILANSVKVTLGPAGRNVMIERPFGDPGVTKDGISVAKEILIPNRIQNMGAQFIKSAAAKTNDKAGDGTTTASVLAQAIIAQGMKAIANGANPVEIQRGIKLGAELVIDKLKELTVEIGDTGEELNQIAYISSNNDDTIGKLIGEAYAKVGKDGVISVEQSKDTTTYVDLTEGMKFGSGYAHPYFVTDKKKGELFLEDVYVLMIEDKISSFNSALKKVMDLSIGAGKSLLIIGEVEGQAMETMLINAYEGGMKVAVCKAPGFGDRKKDLLEDISYVLGGQIISKEKGKYLNKITEEDFGKCASVRADYHDTILVGGEGTKSMIQFRIDELEAQKVNAENDYETQQFNKRIASIKGGVGVIYVGGSTETEMKEKMDRVEDSKNATKAALEEGIVSGGGIALLQAKQLVCGDEKNDKHSNNEGVNVVLDALDAPLRCIVDNAGFNEDVVCQTLDKSEGKNPGFDAKEGKYVANMIEAGIIDPVKVTRIALENAASAAGMLLTTECTITTLMEKSPSPQSGGREMF
jgi:chaperonin GroEL